MQAWFCFCGREEEDYVLFFFSVLFHRVTKSFNTYFKNS